MDPPRRILLIRPSALGDVCRSVPLLATLKSAWPDAAIDWLVNDAFTEAVATHPMLHRAVPFPRRALSRTRLHTPAWWSGLGQLVGRLRRPEGPDTDVRYDLVVDAQGLGRSGLFARLTGAPERWGFADARELGWLGVNRRFRVPRDLHTVDRMLGMLGAAGLTPVPDLRLYAPPPAAGEDSRLDRRLDGRRYAVIAPTSRWPGKSWPAERFAALARALVEDPRLDAVAVVGTRDERDQCAPTLDLAAYEPERVVDLVGRTGVGDLLALIEHADLVVANDSAALHIAVGFHRPLVGLFGPTRVDRVGPYRRSKDVIQAYPPPPERTAAHKDPELGRRMMAAISTRRVVDACLARLADAPDAPGPTTAGAPPRDQPEAHALP